MSKCDSKGCDRPGKERRYNYSGHSGSDSFCDPCYLTYKAGVGIGMDMACEARREYENDKERQKIKERVEALPQMLGTKRTPEQMRDIAEATFNLSPEVIANRNKYPLDSTIDKWAELIVDWRKRKGFDTGWENLSQKLLLIYEELAEVVTVMRTTMNEETRRGKIWEELCDTLIRVLDLLGSTADGRQLSLWLQRIMGDNESRPHKHGKEF